MTERASFDDDGSFCLGDLDVSFVRGYFNLINLIREQYKRTAARTFDLR